MNKIEHIGIAVRSFSTAVPLYEKMLGTKCYKTEVVEEQKVNTAFFHIGESKIELLEPTTKDSVIEKFLEKNGEGMHHIAYAVDDIHAEMKRLQDEGFRLLNEEPQKGADNKWVCFVHPKDCHGVLTELCQDRDED